MNMIFKAFAKKLFGVKCEKLKRTVFLCLVVFWGLYIADWKIKIAPSVLYLMASAFTGGVMWQALTSKDNAASMKNLFMLPFDRRKFVFSYVAALGAYTFFTKTVMLLAVVWAVAAWNPVEILASILCATNAVLMAAVMYVFRKYWYVGVPWAAIAIIVILFSGNMPWFVPFCVANAVLAFLLLQNADAYSFYPQESGLGHAGKKHVRHSVWRYFFRYMKCHKNYLANTAIMWCVGLVLPLFFRQVGGAFAAFIGFAILSLNTPICILLSCEPALEQAVRFLPGQKKAFCIPYCLFIFSCNMIANAIYLCSTQLLNGGVTPATVAAALFFALQSAVCSVLLEWFYPIRGWKIESDLWHHPRKYAVPAGLLLLAGAVGTWPALVPVLMGLLATEVIILLVGCWNSD